MSVNPVFCSFGVIWDISMCNGYCLSSFRMLLAVSLLCLYILCVSRKSVVESCGGLEGNGLIVKGVVLGLSSSELVEEEE